MATYLMLSKLTDKGRARVRSHPERIREVNAEVEELGAHVIAQYALLGDYDFATILDVADNWNMTRLALELGARGTIETRTFPALTIDNFVDFMKGSTELDEWQKGGEFGEIKPSERNLEPLDR